MAAALKRTTLLLVLSLALSAPGQAGLWLDVPFVKQQKEGCGAATIAMVMQYWQQQQNLSLSAAETDAPEIQKILYSKKGHGIYASDLEQYFQRHGFRTFAFTGTWDDLRQHLEKGRPLIVALRPSRLESSLHYVVIAGIDPGRNMVLMNDPAERKLLGKQRAEFEKEWSGTSRWTLLALPQTQPR